MVEAKSQPDRAVDRAQALLIVNALRDGRNCLVGVENFSAGREKLFQAAEDCFAELELSRGTAVRWVKGHYGNGKTHFFGRLVATAHRRNWVTSFTTLSGKGEGVELHRFEEIYGTVIRNCSCQALADLVARNPDQVTPGWAWILDDWFMTIRRLVTPRDLGDVPSFKLRDQIEHSITNLRRTQSLTGSFVEALRQYALAKAEDDVVWADMIIRWFQGEDVQSRGGPVRQRLREAGIKEPITRKNSKEMLRSLSGFLRSRGYKGVFILLDEVENVLLGTPTTRRTSYNTLREFIDNLDDRHGMTSAAIYISATPDLFDSAKGISEYEALAERVLAPAGAGGLNPIGSIIDLGAVLLTADDMVEMANRISKLHGIAQQWQLQGTNIDFRALLADARKKAPDLNVRNWVRIVVLTLDAKVAELKASR
jgi:hypothetical protein